MKWLESKPIVHKTWYSTCRNKYLNFKGSYYSVHLNSSASMPKISWTHTSGYSTSEYLENVFKKQGGVHSVNFAVFWWLANLILLSSWSYNGKESVYYLHLADNMKKSINFISNERVKLIIHMEKHVKLNCFYKEKTKVSKKFTFMISWLSRVYYKQMQNTKIH